MQGIERGTDAMIATMLADMGLLGVKVSRWTLTRFATDYVSDHRDSDDWRDVWLDTWQIDLRTEDPVRFQAPAPGFVGTVAWDETWQGPGEPAATCTVIADFARFREVEVALSVFARLARAEHADAFVAGVQRHLTDAPEPALRELWTRQAESPAPVSATACRAHRQLHVTMPAGSPFFGGGAKLALAAEELCHALGGTTYWRDRPVA